MKNQLIAAISTSQDNKFSFNLEITGIESEKIEKSIVRFVIIVGPIEYTFICEWLADRMYEVNVPRLSHIELSSYPCRVDVIVDGFYFIALTGIVDITVDPSAIATGLTSYAIDDKTGESTIMDNKPTSPKLIKTEEDLSPKANIKLPGRKKLTAKQKQAEIATMIKDMIKSS